MTPSPFVPLARVVKTHGLKGEVSVAPATDLPFVLPEGLEVWFVPPPAGVRTGRIESVRPGPKGPLVKIIGVDGISAAEHLCGREMLARADDIPVTWTLPEEEEFDPVGMSVVDVTRGAIGEITEVIITGANDVWVVHGHLGEVLLPVIDDVVLDIDEDSGVIEVRLLLGLLPDDGDAL